MPHHSCPHIKNNCYDDILVQKLDNMVINGPLKMSFCGCKTATFSDLFLTLKKACHHESGKVKINGYTILYEESAYSRSNIIPYTADQETLNVIFF